MSNVSLISKPNHQRDKAVDDLSDAAHRGGHTDPPRYAGLACPVCSVTTRTLPKFNLSSCRQCGHIFQTDLKVTMEYGAEYAHKHDRYPLRAMSEVRWRFIQSHLHLPAKSRVLDVGYGNGAFLKRARDAGMLIFGIDLHREDFGIPVAQYSDPVDYDLVSFFDSLEHFPDFLPLLNLKARHVIVSLPLTPDFLLKTPLQWRHYKPGEHLHYFSPNSLHAFMRAWGFHTKIAEGHPEDVIRGKLSVGGRSFDNIYTCIYTNMASAAT